MSELCRVPGCETPGPYRVSSRDDPWPLRYACATHLWIVCLSFGEHTGVDYIRPGQVTPPPRETAPQITVTEHAGVVTESAAFHADVQPDRDTVNAWIDAHKHDLLGGW